MRAPKVIVDALRYEILTSELTDVWDLAGKGSSATFPADKPDRRIDYVMVNDDWVEVIEARTLASQASDHLAVVADLVLPPAP